MKPIGGYFEWEFPRTRNTDLHKGSVYLNSGRHAFEYILRGLGNIQRLWVPYFTCNTALQPLDTLKVPYKFYNINDKLELKNEIELGENEYLLYTNYYGIKDSYCKNIAEKYSQKIIIDNAQALFCAPSLHAHQFYSPRKYIGVPDGGIAVTELPDTTNSLQEYASYNRCSHLLKRVELPPSEGYIDFQTNDNNIGNAKLSRISPISKHIFESVDFDFVKNKRRKNFNYLHKVLAPSNQLNIPSMDSFACPLVYPYLCKNGKDLKKHLIEHSIFVATYWPNVLEWTKQNDLEYELANNVVCIPIDQRYGIKEMDTIIQFIQQL